MSWTRFFRRRYWDEERARELEACLEAETDENTARGMPPEKARYAAHRKLGNSTRIRETIYHMNSLGWLESLWQDVRFALRMLRKNPDFTAVAVVTLALGIGANTAIFSVLNAMLLRTLPVRSPQELVEFVRWDPRGTFISNLPPFVFEYLRRDTSVLSGIFAFTSDTRILRSSSGSEALLVHEVSGSYFPTLGVRPLLGRAIDSGDERPDADPHVLVLSYPFWSSHFGRDPAAVGSTLRVGGVTCTVIGVMPPDFFGVDRSQTPQMWVPFPPGPIHSQLWVLGRLKAGVSIPQARVRLAPLFAQALESMRDRMKDWPKKDRDAVLGEKLVVNSATTGTSRLRWN